MRVKKIVREDWWANNLSTGRMCLGQLVRISTNSHPIHNIFYMAYALGIQYGHLHYGLCSGAVPACNRCGPCRRPFYSTSTLLYSALLYICRAAHAAGLCRVGGVWFDGPKQGMHSTVLFLIAERHGIKIHESEPSRDKVLNIHY